mmetsp:Transcript_11748/g.24106  ORF Transcript_11748/g.24106 Transcript_11748/m.24106 type:complete len:125 (+) Transcript_11748:251-625(+)
MTAWVKGAAGAGVSTKVSGSDKSAVLRLAVELAVALRKVPTEFNDGVQAVQVELTKRETTLNLTNIFGLGYGCSSSSRSSIGNDGIERTHERSTTTNKRMKMTLWIAERDYDLGTKGFQIQCYF